jgi:hypothetical protein
LSKIWLPKIWLSEIWLSKTLLSKTWLSQTMWLAVFGLVGLGPVIAIKVAAPPTSLIAEPAPNQSKIEPAFALNESAKSDRLELPRARAETGIIVPTAKPTPAETPSASPETVTPAETPSTGPETVTPMETSSPRPETVKEVADRHWQNANAKLIAVASPRRHPKSKEPKQSADNHSPGERKEVWHCRQDAVGSLLRSLDLSPRCNL